ncbi:integrator complex subunit 8 [Bombina bombina]|uniref:integrator complex subunit 8 n=1 Tax=Bombina bombina TaxID=8345 RepID=UPI00235B280E|nr:integrator complex subunit 8 [Bombina bombina]
MRKKSQAGDKVQGKKMSAEAADREAATSSRPCTPPQTSWFEFLLDESLLESHLQKSFPDPPPVQLIVQFLEQASKPTVNEQNQVQPPTDNKRNRTLKLLALKVAAHLKWDLDILEKSLSVPVLNMLLNELLCVSKVPPGMKHVDLDLSSLPPTTVMAVMLYNRWAIRTIVQSSFPVKPVKQGPLQPNVMNQIQQEKELTENILKVLKEQADDSIAVLEEALKLKKNFYVHTMRTLDLLAVEPGMVNGETQNSTAGLKISSEEMHCQVCYDLGALYFQQGSVNPPSYEKARDHFFNTKQLLAKFGAVSDHCFIDEKRLAGYCQACGVLAPSTAITHLSTPYCQIHNFMKSGNYQGIIKIFFEDNQTCSLPDQFRQSVLRELFQKAQQGNEALAEVCFKVCACNTVCDILHGRPSSVHFNQLFMRPNKEKIDYLLEVCSKSLNLNQSSSDTAKRTIATFLKDLCLGMEDLQLVFMISSHELFIKLLTDDERKMLVEQIRKRNSRVNLCTKPVTSFYDIPASASVNIGQLEHQLILSVDPWRIRQILIELHGMTSDSQYWMVSSKWEIPSIYSGIILGIKDNLTRDMVFILMAKGLHCSAIKNYLQAKQLFAACLELVTEFSPKLRQVTLNEMLLLDIRTYEAGTGLSGERPAPELISRVRGYLEMRIPDIPLRQIVSEECVAFLLNWRENEYLTQQVPASLVQSNPYVKLGQLLAATCKELPGPDGRRTAKDLWEVVVQICSISNQHKRSNDGRVSLIKNRDSTLGIMYRSELVSFIKKLREPLVLTTLLSLFVKLHNLREDIVNDISAEHINIWPASIPNLQSVDFDAVSVTLKELVNYALTINSNNHSWLIVQADIYFATNQYSAALNYYLQAGAVCSEFFTKQVPPEIYTDQVIKRMIKCCSLLNCHTQVAILCQFLREVDYKTAFKALQEQNSHDAMDSYYEYIWDVTILEYLTYLHHKRGEMDKRQIAIRSIGQTELNASNPEEVLLLAAQRRKKMFLQAMAKLYF